MDLFYPPSRRFSVSLTLIKQSIVVAGFDFLSFISEKDTNADFHISDQRQDAEPMFEGSAISYGELEDGVRIIVNETGAIMEKHEDDHGSGSDKDMADYDPEDGVGVIVNETGAIMNKHEDDQLKSGRKMITDYLVIPSVEDIIMYVSIPVAMFESMVPSKPSPNDVSWDNETAEMYPAGGGGTMLGGLVHTPNSTVPFFIDYKSGYFDLSSWPRDLTEAYQEVERWLQVKHNIHPISDIGSLIEDYFVTRRTQRDGGWTPGETKLSSAWWSRWRSPPPSWGPSSSSPGSVLPPVTKTTTLWSRTRRL